MISTLWLARLVWGTGSTVVGGMVVAMAISA
jgi:hypothetical protein